MNKANMVKAFDERLADVRNILANIDKGIGPSGSALSEKVIPTRKAEFNKTKNFILLARTLVNQVKGDEITLDAVALETFNALVYPDTKTRLVVSEGENILTVLKTSGKTFDAVVKAGEKAGLTLGNDGIFRKE